MTDSTRAVRVAVPGAMGRMGSMVVRRVLADNRFTLVGAVERHDHPDVAADIGKLLTGKPADVPLEADLRNCMVSAQVIIDFTAPEASLRHAEIAANNGIAMVLGTTGFTDEQEKRLGDLLGRVPCVRASNFSIGVNLCLRLVEHTAQTLGPDWDVEIVEAHHRQKQDAPSGTALALAGAVARGWDEPLQERMVVGRPKGIAQRGKGSIGVHSVRAGQIIGEHTVLFAGEQETLRIEHRAQGREVFVEGALLAAKWVIGKEPGQHSMFEVLEIY